MILDHNLPLLSCYAAQPHHAQWACPTLTLTLPAGRGEYVLRHYSPRPTAVPSVSLQSPVSAAAYTYAYHPEQQRWECTADGHLLIELLVRELTPICRGYPNF